MVRLPPAWHVDLSDDEASKQMEEGVHVRGADSRNLHVGCQRHCYHSCKQQETSGQKATL